MTTDREGVQNFPLYWPQGWKRTSSRERSRFGDTNTYRESQAIYREMGLLGAKRVVVSTNMALRQDGLPYANQRRPDDPGAAVWFWLPRPGRWDPRGSGNGPLHSTRPVGPESWAEHVLACDRWDRVEHNLRAIAKHVEALRGQERWGVGSLEQAFGGYKALPETAGGRPWWVVLGVDETASPEEIELSFKRRAREHHPDTGGDPAMWHELENARRQARDAHR